MSHDPWDPNWYPKTPRNWSNLSKTLENSGCPETIRLTAMAVVLLGWSVLDGGKGMIDRRHVTEARLRACLPGAGQVRHDADHSFQQHQLCAMMHFVFFDS